MSVRVDNHLTAAEPVTHLKAIARDTSRLLPDFVGAAISAFLALAGATAVLQLWLAHPNVPVSEATGDSMFVLMEVKNMQTSGWFQGTPALGAPFGQDLTAFPSAVGDMWNMVPLKVLSTFLTPAATVNLFFILGFPVIAAVAYCCLRLLRVSRPFACVLGPVYACLPYHFLRSEYHLFLSMYYAVPVACVLAVFLYQGRLNLWVNPRRMTRAQWAALAGALLLAGTGAYYAAFAMVLFVVAGGLASLSARTWRPLLSGGLLATVIGAVLVLQAIPNFLHTSTGDLVVEGRTYGATVIYGLNITNLLLPLDNHRIPALADLRTLTANSVITGEGGSETLGVLGVVGLLAVTLAVLLPVLHRKSELVRRLQPLGVMAVVALLFGTAAGLNSTLAAFGFAEIRAWNRISVLIGFLALAGLGHLLDAGRARWGAGSAVVRRVVTAAVAGLVLIVGVYDQTSLMMVPNHADAAKSWTSDEAYFARVQNKLGADASLFALPYAQFPGIAPIVKMTDYSHLRGYLHSDLSWSYGGVKGGQSEWQAVALQDGPAAALPKMVVAGFDGVYINRTGYADAGAKVESGITAVIGPQVPLVNADKTLAVYDLRPYAKSLDLSGTRLPSRESVLYPVLITYGTGVYGSEAAGTANWRWAQGSAAMTLDNPSPRPAELVLRGAIHVADAHATIVVRIGDHETRLRQVDGRAELAIPLTVKPGTTPVQISTDSTPTPGAPNDFRDLRQQLLNITIW